jgi:hypothetical protein
MHGVNLTDRYSLKTKTKKKNYFFSQPAIVNNNIPK